MAGRRSGRRPRCRHLRARSARFADTSFWFGLQERRDGRHQHARALVVRGVGRVVTTNHVVGDLVRGRIVRHAPFGVFIELDEGLEGLCHVSELEEADRQNVEQRFRLGDEAEFKIIKMSPNEHKIGLSHKAIAEEVERREYDSYRDGADGSATLADLFHAKDNS